MNELHLAIDRLQRENTELRKRLAERDEQIEQLKERLTLRGVATTTKKGQR